jgi:uncharacterized protein (TIGR00369 family)
VSADPPEGFEPFTRPSPLLDPWRPIYARRDSDRIVLGAHLREAHCNSRGSAHGGFLAALADQAMGMSCGVKLTLERIAITNLWTTSLTIDYLGPTSIGQWLAFDTIFARVGKTLCHAEIDITADGETVARGRAAFRCTVAKD